MILCASFLLARRRGVGVLQLLLSVVTAYTCSLLSSFVRHLAKKQKTKGGVRNLSGGVHALVIAPREILCKRCVRVMHI